MRTGSSRDAFRLFYGKLIRFGENFMRVVP